MNEMRLNKARLNVVSLNKALINGAVERHGSSAGGGGAPSKYIRFADPAVEAVLMSNGVSSDGVGITMEDAAKVTNMREWFKNNTAIRTFNELQYFTGLTTLSQDIFFGSSLEVVTFPATMTAFGNYCFYQLAGMDTLEIPATITTIGTYLLSYSSIVKVIMRATTPPEIANYTFRFHGGAVSIYVPDASLEAYKTATNWVDMAAYIHPLSELEGSPYITFADPEVERVLMENNVSSDGVGITMADAEAVTSIGTWFKGNTAIVSFDELEYFTGLTDIYGVYPNGAFMNCTSLQSIRIPEGVTSIKGQAFLNCTALTNITFPNTLNSISWEAFNKAALTNLDLILDNVTTIGEAAFRSTGSRSIVLPKIDTITSNYGSVGNSNTFAACGNLQYSLLGKSCTNVGNWGCFQDSAITTLICLATTPPSGGSICDNTPISNGSGYIYVPDASVDAYKATGSDGWAKYSSRIKGISSLATDNPTLYEEIKDYLS